jgi:hypothetical protein
MDFPQQPPRRDTGGIKLPVHKKVQTPPRRDTGEIRLNYDYKAWLHNFAEDMLGKSSGNVSAKQAYRDDWIRFAMRCFTWHNMPRSYQESDRRASLEHFKKLVMPAINALLSAYSENGEEFVSEEDKSSAISSIGEYVPAFPFMTKKDFNDLIGFKSKVIRDIKNFPGLDDPSISNAIANDIFPIDFIMKQSSSVAKCEEDFHGFLKVASVMAKKGIDIS